MLWKAETGLVVTERAKQAISARVAEPRSYPAVPALLLSQDMQTKTTQWEVALYDRRTVEGRNFDGVLIQPSGLDLVLIQSNLIELLNRMQLDWDGARFLVKQKESKAP
jgi:hypothetical protein